MIMTAVVMPTYVAVSTPPVGFTGCEGEGLGVGVAVAGGEHHVVIEQL